MRYIFKKRKRFGVRRGRISDVHNIPFWIPACVVRYFNKKKNKDLECGRITDVHYVPLRVAVCVVR